MKNLKLTKRILYSLVTTYFIVMLIPTVLLTSVTLYNTKEYIKNEINAKNTTTVNQVSIQIDNLFNGMQQIALAISSNGNLSDNFIQYSEYNQYVAINDLNKYKKSYGFIDDIFLYYNDAKSIYSTTSCYTVSRFFKYNIDNAPVRELESVFSDTSIINTTNILGDDLLLIKYINTNNDNSMIIFSVKKEVFDNIAEFAIQDSKNHILFGDMNDSIFYSTMNKKTDLEKLENRYHLYKSDTLKSNFRIYFLADEKSVYLYLMDSLKVTLFTLVLCGVVEIFIIYLLTKINYIPIKKSMEGESSGEKRKYRNFLNIFGMSLANYINDNQQLQSKIEEYKPQIRQQLLHDLIIGNFNNLNTFHEAFDNVNTSLSQESHVIVIVMPDEMNISQKDDMSYFICEKCEKYSLKAYNIDTTNNKIMAFMISSPDLMLINEKLDDIKIAFNNEYICEVTISVGRVCDTIYEIQESYKEAIISLDYRFLYGKNKIIFYDNIEKYINNNVADIDADVNILTKVIFDGDFKVLNEMLKNISDQIENNNITILSVKNFCYNILNSIKQKANEMNIDISDLSDMDFDMAKILEYSTIDEITDYLLNICTFMSTVVSDNQMNNMKQQIESFIEENYTNNDFSLKDLAYNLGVSYNYLSSQFKRLFDMTYVEYVSNKRLEKAKELLSTTDMNISEIVNKVGYYDTSSFAKRFKNQTGMSPGSWRKHNKEI